MQVQIAIGLSKVRIAHFEERGAAKVSMAKGWDNLQFNSGNRALYKPSSVNLLATSINNVDSDHEQP